ncbi:MAG: hypothetical protein IKL53_00945 [Lachnospiraceae bacterium]|nr:hypothetical protein [Lachnospiraceae bacterium]
MLEFINNNGVLFSGIFSIIVALISALVTVSRDNKKNKLDTIKFLRKEVETLKAELSKSQDEINELKSIEYKEMRIDKSHGTMYYESLSNGKRRAICGVCWEKEHIMIPVDVDIMHDEYINQYYYSGKCSLCKNGYTENITSKQLEKIIKERE